MKRNGRGLGEEGHTGDIVAVDGSAGRGAVAVEDGPGVVGKEPGCGACGWAVEGLPGVVTGDGRWGHDPAV